MDLVLSVFTGAGLLDKGFQQAGFCVVSAGDILWGHDVRDFWPARHVFKGLIGGSPCQGFSRGRIGAVPGDATELYSREMVKEFERVVAHAGPDWFLLENVPQVPDVSIEGYTVQRLNLNASELGIGQNRLRCFQFGSRDGIGIVIPRGQSASGVSRCCMASEAGKPGARSWQDFCELQGLPRSFDLPGLSIALKYRLVGNGVPVQMARVVAISIKHRAVTADWRVCVCGCGRPVGDRQTMATAACRKRMQRRRDAAGVTHPGCVTPGLSQCDGAEEVTAR